MAAAARTAAAQNPNRVAKRTPWNLIVVYSNNILSRRCLQGYGGVICEDGPHALHAVLLQLCSLLLLL